MHESGETDIRPIAGFEHYLIGADGVIYGLQNRRPLKQNPDTCGYLAVNLSTDGKAQKKPVHVLVCTTFHGPKPEPHLHASHLDDDKLNNHASNLAWETPQKNCDRKMASGVVQWAKGERQGLARLTETDVRAIRASSASQYALAEQFGVSRSTIAQVRTNKTWQHVTNE